MVRIDSNSSANCSTELKGQEWRLTITRMRVGNDSDEILQKVH
jgi:hypothetical protein